MSASSQTLRKSTAESRREETGMHLPAAEARRKGTADGRPERSPVSLGNQGADRKSTAGSRTENPECIRHIAEPTEKVQHMAVQRSPDIFRQIRQPEESVRLAAVQAKGENIRYVSAPSEAVQLAAVRNDPMNIRYIENPTEKVQSVVLNADRDAAPFISSPTEEIKRLAMEMYGLRLENAAGKEAAAARTSETSGDSGKKAAEDVAKKPSAKQVREAVEKLDSEIREINREYFQATYEAQYSDNAAERESEVSAAGKTGRRSLSKLMKNSTRQPFRKGRNAMWGRLSRNYARKGWPWKT